MVRFFTWGVSKWRAAPKTSNSVLIFWRIDIEKDDGKDHIITNPIPVAVWLLLLPWEGARVLLTGIVIASVTICTDTVQHCSCK